MSSFIQSVIALNNLPLSASLSLTQVTDLQCGIETFIVHCSYDREKISCRMSPIWGEKLSPNGKTLLTSVFYFGVSGHPADFSNMSFASQGSCGMCVAVM